MSAELVRKLFSFYRFDDHIKTQEQKEEIISLYANELCKRHIPDVDGVFSYIVNNYKYKSVPTIEFINKAVGQLESTEDQKARSLSREDDNQKEYIDFYNRRRANRVAIYHSNTDRIENIIARGWGMDLACELSYCAEKADTHGQMDSLVSNIHARAHYASPRTKGQDPLYYFENMPINERNLKINLKKPVEFIEGVRS